MSVYLITAYDITDHEKYAPYVSGSMSLVEKYGAEIIAADTNAITVDGDSRDINVIMKFPSTEVAMQLLEDPDYQPWKQIRLGSTTNRISILVNEFDAEQFALEGA